jgi:hypothetical protein
MSGSISKQIVTDGLVLYLDAANPISYPTTGTLWTDLTINKNNGTLTNDPTFNSDNGGSIVFDGSNDFVTLSNTVYTQFPHNLPWTISLTGKIISQNTTFPGFLVKGAAASTGVLIFYSNNNLLTIKHNNVQPNVVITTESFIVTWVHTGNGTTLIYLNGNYKTDGPSMVSTDTTNPLLLGRGDMFGNVSIYNFLKYDRALSAAEVLQNYNATKYRFGL